MANQKKGAAVRTSSLHMKVDSDLLARLDKWCASQLVPPSRTDAVHVAIRRFLEAVEPIGAAEKGTGLRAK
jgi:hypothetical protein